MVRTRTYTRYFGEDDLVPLLEKAAELRRDYEERKQFMLADHQTAIELRLGLLDSAIILLGDIAD